MVQPWRCRCCYASLPFSRLQNPLTKDLLCTKLLALNFNKIPQVHSRFTHGYIKHLGIKFSAEKYNKNEIYFTFPYTYVSVSRAVYISILLKFNSLCAFYPTPANKKKSNNVVFFLLGRLNCICRRWTGNALTQHEQRWPDLWQILEPLLHRLKDRRQTPKIQ